MGEFIAPRAEKHILSTSSSATMSGAGDDRFPPRWRGGRGFDQNRHPGQRHQGGNLRDRSLGGHQHDRHPHRGYGNNANAANSWGAPHGGPAQEQHVPVKSFNAMESKGALKQGYQNIGSRGALQEVPVYAASSS
ncbi:hypothetical protein GX51_00783 [Blastomyces parvus]|uniref:Uncharacterized protein n=1 Tax=Blastomyces parvus TaxID=2060905 RepID=A0A2B7XK91_9EURO|nr:hypothetical protein GX51_00783 [Blastomyces parvus]